MNAKKIIAAVVSAIALVGDIVFMAILFSMGEAAGALSQAATTPDMQELAGTFSMVITGAWIWSVFVLVACLFGIYFSVFEGRKKK